MRLLKKYESLDFSDPTSLATFGFVDRVKGLTRDGLQQMERLVRRGKGGARTPPKRPKKPQAPKRPMNRRLTAEQATALIDAAEDAKNYRQGIWGKLGTAANVVMAAGTPLMVAPLLIEDANTKAVKAMRAEDRVREAMGLKPLAATPQMIAEDAAKVAKNAVNSFSYSKDDTRIVNMAPKYLLPADFPPNSFQ